MLAAQKTSKKKMILYIILITAMLVGNVLVYYYNSREAELDIADTFSFLGPDKKIIPAAKTKTSASQAVLDHNLFIVLKKIGDWPVTPENIGKADPFAPFFNQ